MPRAAWDLPRPIHTHRLAAPRAGVRRPLHCAPAWRPRANSREALVAAVKDDTLVGAITPTHTNAETTCTTGQRVA